VVPPRGVLDQPLNERQVLQEELLGRLVVHGGRAVTP
jgi:hypothetical protein